MALPSFFRWVILKGTFFPSNFILARSASTISTIHLENGLCHCAFFGIMNSSTAR